MAYEQRSYAGNATDTTLAADITGGVLSFTVPAGAGANYPDGSAGPFYVIIDFDNSKAEKIRVTSRLNDTFTAPSSNGRGVDGTAAQAHTAGAKIRHCWTAVDAQEANRAALNTVGQVTTKGDLLAAPSANTLNRVGVGADNSLLAADSTAAAGVSYKTLAALLALIETTKGDLVVSNGTTAVRLAVGANNTILVGDSTAAGGVSYKTFAALAALLATTKGDLLVNNGTTVIRLPVGTDSQVLTADSAQAAGVKWAGAVFHGARVYSSIDVAIATGGAVVPFDSESFDTDAYHSTSSNTSRITVPTGLAGKYLITGVVEWATNATGNRSCAIYKNGAAAAWGTEQPAATAWNVAVSSATILDLAVADYVELFAFQNSGGNLNALHINPGADTRLEVAYLGA